MDRLDQQIDIKELIVSYLSGNATPDDTVYLKNWMKQSSDNLIFFNEMKQVWQVSAMISATASYNNLKAYNTISSKIKESISQQKSIRSGIFGTKNILKIAAILLLMISIGGISSYFITKSIYAPQIAGTVFFEAPIGSRAIATLPDGTKIWLNAGSRLEYTADYNKQQREVKLIGEGFFKVKTDPSKPFFVSTTDITIKATGTSFNVKAYPGERLVTTTLVEGKVEIKGKGINDQLFSYQMKPKQKVVYFNDDKLFASIQLAKTKPQVKIHNSRHTEKEELPLSEKAPIVANTDVKTELYTSWKDERWIIESEKLGELAILFERRYNVNILFDNNEIRNYRFSATIQNETIEQIFEIMRFTLPISFKADKGKITLRTDRNLKNMYKSAYQKQ